MCPPTRCGGSTRSGDGKLPLANRPVHRRLVHAYGAVKLAAARANHELGRWDEPMAAAIEAACREMIDGRLDRHVVVDALQGGAGNQDQVLKNEISK